MLGIGIAPKGHFGNGSVSAASKHLLLDYDGLHGADAAYGQHPEGTLSAQGTVSAWINFRSPQGVGKVDFVAQVSEDFYRDVLLLGSGRPSPDRLGHADGVKAHGHIMSANDVGSVVDGYGSGGQGAAQPLARFGLVQPGSDERLP